MLAFDRSRTWYPVSYRYSERVNADYNQGSKKYLAGSYPYVSNTYNSIV